ncbi:MAG: hypothetical protein ACE5E7_07530 [Anaerolineae bacterium]
MTHKPDDFRLIYHWRAGSMPPPYHYEYTIHLGPGSSGEIIFHPDYPAHEPPVWRETFSITKELLDQLYALMISQNIFRQHWTVKENAPVGGSQDWLEVIADKHRYNIPARAEERERLATIYRAIRDLVPTPIWDGMMARREQFKEGYI